jgi:hypothetical protein
MTANPTQTNEIDRIEVSNHAKQRLLERIEVAAYPAERIRELLAKAEPTADHESVTSGVAWVADEAIVVTDSALEAVTTVLRPGGS